MTTCLINDQINDKRKMSILSEDTLLEGGTLFQKNFQSRSLDTCCELDSMSELSGFVYIKNHVILHVKFKAQKLNCYNTENRKCSSYRVRYQYYNDKNTVLFTSSFDRSL